MALKEEKKQFALKAIRPYAKDRSLCAVDGTTCMYLDSKGRKCVLGQFIKDGHPAQLVQAAADEILNKYPQEKLLVPEAVGILSAEEWRRLQRIHDRLARNEVDSPIVKVHVDELGLFTYEELIAD